MRILPVAAMLLMALSGPAHTDEMFGFAAGINGVWVDNEAQPTDYEAGAACQIGLTPNISLPVQAWYGIEHSYARAIGGVHITVTDANRRDFSVGIGGEYQLSSEPEVRPEEWRWTASVGLQPVASFPRLLLTGKGAYGAETNQADVLVGVRWIIGGAR